MRRVSKLNFVTRDPKNMKQIKVAQMGQVMVRNWKPRNFQNVC